jgi:uncharacterized protein YggE
MKRLLIIGCCLLGNQLYGQIKSSGEFIAVIGESSGTYIPDMITFHFSIDVIEKKQDDAVRKLNEQANLFVDKVINLGINPKEIKLSSYNLQQALDYSGDKAKSIGYEASESLELEIRYSENSFNQFIDSISGTKFPNLSFNYMLTFSDSLRDEILKDLVKKASDNAMNIARTLADSRNVQLGDVYSIEYTKNIASLYGVEYIPPPPSVSEISYHRDSSPQINSDRISLKGIEKSQQVRIVYIIINDR